jgi:diguanylate cyclase (GGDEF)-like protein/PAS domain S-box-containing protein
MVDSIKKTNRVLEAFKSYDHFCKAMLDGFVVIDETGKILKSNPIVAQLSGLSSKLILNLNSFDDMFSLTIGNRPLKITGLLENNAPTRFDEIGAKGHNGKELNFIIGYYPFLENGKVIGAWLLLRDVTAETQLQGKYKDKATKSITDPMTGLYNRAYFEEFIKNQDSALASLPAESDHRNLSAIMGDIDFFKKINDKYGHPAGDYVIKTVADIMKAGFRKTDVVCRYGGEEFLVLLPASDLEGAAIAAEKVRQNIETFRFEFEGKHIPVSMSMGVSQFIVGKELGKDLIARADAALYSSKQNGRNRVTLHTGSGTIASPFAPTKLPRAI